MHTNLALPQAFYQRHAVDVAQGLLGKCLVVNGQKAIITETEAYRGADDAASHAFRGLTPRTATMFGPPGHAYVYLIYGMYYCFNIVTEQEGQPSAVLVRGGWIDGQHRDGPGKFCRALGITKALNGISLLNNPTLYVTEGVPVSTYQTTPRIGIKQAQDKLWRFVMNAPTFLTTTTGD